MFYKKYKSILSPQNGMNIYRGCTHGCIYCDSHSDCYQINPEFELNGNANIEWYDVMSNGKNDPNYHSGIWIPIKRKK